MSATTTTAQEDNGVSAASVCLDTTTQRWTAIVIGAGPAGLATSLALAQACEKVILMEKHDEFRVQGSSFGVMRNGMKALGEISHDLVRDMENSAISFPGGGLLMPWWEMRDTLLRHVRRSPNIELHTGKEFVDIRDQGEEGGVRVRFTDGTDVHGNFLVGADGVHSAVREWLGLPPALSTNSTVFRGAMFVNELSSDKLKLYIEGESIFPFSMSEYQGVYFAVFNFHQRYPGRLAWVFTWVGPVDPDVHPLSLLGDIVNKDQLAIIKEIFESSQADHLKPFPGTKVIDFSDEVLQGWDGRWGGRGLVTIVGDAAHAMRPTDGQGGNQAFEDAVVLARCLKRARKDLDAALEEFERIRVPRVKRIHDNQRIRYEEGLNSSRKPMDPEMKDFILQGV